VEGPLATEPNGWLPVVVDATEVSAGEQTLAVRIGQAVIEVRSGFDQRLFTDVAGLRAQLGLAAVRMAGLVTLFPCFVGLFGTRR
jgi:hypothetical protein